MISPRHRAVASWMLALAALRFLVPAGYMPMNDNGRLSFMICDGSGWMAPDMASHHHHQGLAPAGPHAGNTDCSYAQSAAPALLPVELPPLLAAVTRNMGFEAVRHDPIAAKPWRHTHARGPPAHA